MTLKRDGAELNRSRPPPLLAHLTIAATVSILASCGGSQPSDASSDGPAVDLGLMTSSTYCGLTPSRFEFRSQPQSGYAVLLLIDSYSGTGGYSDITKDMDSATGTKLTMHSVGRVRTPVVRGVAASGLVNIDSVAGNLMTGRLKAHVIDDANQSHPKGFEVTGSWACFLTPPGAVSTSQAPSPPPARSP
jgi:hypothetical protein